MPNDYLENAMSPNDVLRLSPYERQQRLEALKTESYSILQTAIGTHIKAENKKLVATCVLFSGGNDSTLLFDLFKDNVDYAIHANTTIGIEQTREFVRNVCKEWSVPLLEFLPPDGSSYRELVLSQGFPGPGMHYKMYQRLKERALRQARRQIVKNGRSERVVYLAGRRRTESARRANVPAMNREGSVVWVSPMINWTKPDMQMYRERHGSVPHNEVSDLIHMSGECLCGAFAHKGELEEIEMFFPDVAKQIRNLEKEVRAAGIPEKKCRWGWGANVEILENDLKAGPLCTSCEYRMETANAE